MGFFDNEELGIGEEIGLGLLSGARNNPFIKPVIDTLANEFGGVSEETLDSFASRLERGGGTVGNVAKLIGEYGPEFALGLGSFTAGRIGARAALAAAGRGGAGSLAKISARIATTAGEAPQFLTKGQFTTLRAAEALGGSLGIGTLEASRHLIEGEEVPEALKAGAVAAAVTFGAEAALFGVGAAIPAVRRQMFDVDPAKIKKLAEASLAGSETAIAAARGRSESLVQQINEHVASVLNPAAAEVELTRSATAGMRRIAPSPEIPGARGAPGGARRAFQRQLGKAKSERQLQLETQMADPKSKLFKLRADEVAARQEAQSLQLLREDAMHMLTSDSVYDPVGIRFMAAVAGQKFFSVPESLFNRMGPTFSNFGRQVKAANSEQALGTATAQKEANEIFDQVSKAAGFTTGIGRRARDPLKLTQDPRWKTLFSKWQQGSDELADYARTVLKLDAADTQDLVNGFNRLSPMMAEVHKPLAEAGVFEVTEGFLKRQRQKNFFPVLFSQKKDDTLEESLTAVFNSHRAKQIMEIRGQGMSSFASARLQIQESGTYEEILKRFPEGVLEDNPWIAVMRFMSEGHHRLAMGKRFGFTRETTEKVRTVLLDSVKAEAAAARKTGSKAPREGEGAEALASTLSSFFLGRKYYDDTAVKLSAMLTGAQVMTKLTLGAIPNFTQSGNTAMFVGLRNTIRGMQFAVRGSRPGDGIAAAHLGNTIQKRIGRAWSEEALRQSETGIPVLDKLGNAIDQGAGWLLRGTLFSASESMNRQGAYGASYLALADAYAKGIHGQLRGRHADTARRMAREMGVNLDEIVQRGKATLSLPEAEQFGSSPEFIQLMQRASFEGSQLTQFIPGTTRRPLVWQTPAGRVFFQFKNFALGQSRFLRDQVFAEAARGNLKPLAYFAAFAPIAGEAVSDVKAIIRQKDRDVDGFARIWSNALSVGGFGLATDMFTAAQYGKLQSTLLGPSVTDITQMAELALRGNFEAGANFVARQPIAQAIDFLGATAGLGGLAAGNYLRLKAQQLDSEESGEAASFEELQMQRVGDKQ